MTAQVEINCFNCGDPIGTGPNVVANAQTMQDGRPITRAVCAVCGPIHCLRCKGRTDTLNPEVYTMGNGKPGTRGACAACGGNKNRIGAVAVLLPSE